MQPTARSVMGASAFASSKSSLSRMRLRGQLAEGLDLLGRDYLDNDDVIEASAKERAMQKRLARKMEGRCHETRSDGR
jgi:hypothetical protein